MMKSLSILFLLVSSLGAQVKPKCEAIPAVCQLAERQADSNKRIKALEGRVAKLESSNRVQGAAAIDRPENGCAYPDCRAVTTVGGGPYCKDKEHIGDGGKCVKDDPLGASCTADNPTSLCRDAKGNIYRPSKDAEVSGIGVHIEGNRFVMEGPFFTCSGSDECPELYRSSFHDWIDQCKKSPALDVCRKEQANTWSHDAKVVLFHCLNGEGRTCVLPVAESEQTVEWKEFCQFLEDSLYPPPSVKAEPQKPVTPAPVIVKNLPMIIPVAGIDAKPMYESAAFSKVTAVDCLVDGNTGALIDKSPKGDCGLQVVHVMAEKMKSIILLESEKAELLKTISDQQKVITRLEKGQRSHSAATTYQPPRDKKGRIPVGPLLFYWHADDGALIAEEGETVVMDGKSVKPCEKGSVDDKGHSKVLTNVYCSGMAKK